MEEGETVKIILFRKIDVIDINNFFTYILTITPTKHTKMGGRLHINCDWYISKIRHDMVFQTEELISIEEIKKYPDRFAEYQDVMNRLHTQSVGKDIFLWFNSEVEEIEQSKQNTVNLNIEKVVKTIYKLDRFEFETKEHLLNYINKKL